MSNWRTLLEQLDISVSEAAGPAGADGEWSQLVAAFGTKAFMRVLTDGAELVLECAPPGEPKRFRTALDNAGWSFGDEESVPFIARRPLPSDIDAMRVQWISVARLADAIRAEDADAFIDALTPAEPVQEESEADDDEPATPDTKPKTPAGGSAFESIGEEQPRPAMEAPFAFRVAIAGDVVEATLGFAEVLAKHDYDSLERRLVGNLRGKYDVNVEIVPAHEVQTRLDVDAKTRVALRVRPDGLSIAKTEEAVGSYFETLLELAGSGIDPLVFLGVHASKRNTGAFEAIGGGTAEPVMSDESTTTLLVDDDEPDDDEDTADEVVFGAGAPLDADAPLQSHRYDDERLQRSDATTALVDVVLRHPGYSDKNIGQVMSILFSLDYSSCLDIAARAPTVVAWGVARDRALTMKTVMEGAGGKVVLVEPGTFGTD